MAAEYVAGLIHLTMANEQQVADGSYSASRHSQSHCIFGTLTGVWPANLFHHQPLSHFLLSVCSNTSLGLDLLNISEF